ncbi:MAG TPA: 5-methyltetrahydropteroyltriglutamate--homocysteine S-methyltransferase [Steroidobacteraceae bacterium]|nr:5-methyltetrahydropteroyltriglutamate--homocysteine S-methyltransferase [Steroidobacteraceae bacterium]
MPKPLFRADQVGSLLRPLVLRQARAQRAAGKMSAAELQRIEDSAIEGLLARQIALGLRAVTDGELRRESWIFDFFAALPGIRVVTRNLTPVAHGGAAPGGGRPMKVPIVVDKLAFGAHPLVEHFRFLKAHTQAVAKMTIPCPTMLISASRDWRDIVDRGVYPRIEDFYADLSAVYRTALRTFYEAGCRYLQLDDVNLAFLCDGDMRAKLAARGDPPEQVLNTWVGILRETLAGRPSDMTISTHICRGNFRSSWMAQGGYEAVADALFNQLDYDAYFLEYDTDRAGGFEPLRFVPKGPKRVVLGLITTKSGELESPDSIKRRIETATKYVSLDQLALSPQCGFASTEDGNLLTEEEQWAKLGEVVDIARGVWRDS